MAHVPTYVLVLFFVLVYMGIQRSFAREINPARLFLFPAILIANGLYGLHGLMGDFSVVDLLALGVAAAGGTLIGWQQGKRWRLVFNADASIVRIPGDVSLLLVILFTFAFQFAIHYGVAAHRPWAASVAFVPAALAVWGLLAGMPLGRALNVWMRRSDALANPASMQAL